MGVVQEDTLASPTSPPNNLSLSSANQSLKSGNPSSIPATAASTRASSVALGQRGEEEMGELGLKSGVELAVVAVSGYLCERMCMGYMGYLGQYYLPRLL